MKSVKVLNLRTHLGVIRGTYTSVDMGRHTADMIVIPACGVLIRTLNGKIENELVPWSNIVGAKLESDPTQVDDIAEKRGPGRPPKQE